MSPAKMRELSSGLSGSLGILSGDEQCRTVCFRAISPVAGGRWGWGWAESEATGRKLVLNYKQMLRAWIPNDCELPGWRLCLSWPLQWPQEPGLGPGAWRG